MLNRMSPAACPRVEDTVFAANPLFASAIPESAQIVDGRLLIPLLPRWPVLLRGLSTLGPVVSFCGNPWALLGAAGCYPEVWSTPCGRRAHGGGYEFFFPLWSRAFAALEEQSGSWVCTAEFVDRRGNVLHKIRLTEDSDWEAFRWWVQINRAASSVAETTPSVSAARGVGGLFSREEEILPVSAGAFRAMLREIVQEGFSVQVCLSNPGLVQQSEVRPILLREEGESLLLAAEDCGLQTRLGAPVELCFPKLRNSPGWALGLRGPAGNFAFSLRASLHCRAQRGGEMLAALLRHVREA
jgi:hypothetical protein